MKISEEELSILVKDIVVDELSSIESNDVIKVFSFKFLVYFRLKIPDTWYPSIIDLFLNLMSKNTPLYINGSLLALEKMLFMKDMKNFNHHLLEDTVNNLDILTKLVNGIIPVLVNYNQSAMICFNKIVLLVTDQNLAIAIPNFITVVLDVFKIIVSLKAENYNNEFNYQFFETTAYILNKSYALNQGEYLKFKQSLNTIMESCMNNNLIDLYNYIFQLFALELSLDKDYSNTQNVSLTLIIVLLIESTYIYS